MLAGPYNIGSEGIIQSDLDSTGNNGRIQSRDQCLSTNSKYTPRPGSNNRLGDFSQIFAFLEKTTASLQGKASGDNAGLPLLPSRDATRSLGDRTPSEIKRAIGAEPESVGVVAASGVVALTPLADMERVRKPIFPTREELATLMHWVHPALSFQPPQPTESLGTLFFKLERERAIDIRIKERHDPHRTLTTHIFVDMSNIYIGFNETFKSSRDIPSHVRTPLAPLNFGALSHILERGRTVGARELVGSAADPENLGDLPSYFHDARKLGYQTSILRRVLKPIRANRDVSSRSTPSSSGSSSSESGGEYYGIARREMCYREQGVDEILQLKMGNTAMACLDEPGIMVLATGDAEKAEYSDGFQKQVERILKMGWLIEVVSWKKGLSRSWMRPSWTLKWGKQFRIIVLDDYMDDILAG